MLFLWDVDGDGIMDAEGREVLVRFADAGEREVRLTASNPGKSCGKTVSKTLTVKAPDLQVASVGEPFELSGDGDGVMEPGERWAMRVALTNEGNARASNPRAVFSQPGAGLQSVGPDAFGYTATTSLISPACPYQFVNIGGTNSVAFRRRAFPGQTGAAIEQFPVLRRQRAGHRNEQQRLSGPIGKQKWRRFQQ